MKSRKPILPALALFAVSSFQAEAALIDVLAWTDLNQGTSVIPGAVGLLGSDYALTLAPDQATFNTLLTAGGWEVVLFGEQNTAVFAGSSAQLTSYVSGGGKLIGATWQTGGLINLLQGTRIGTNSSPITTSVDPIYDSPFDTGATIALSNPGWSTFSGVYNPIGGAVGVGTVGSGFATIRGNGGNTLLNTALFDSYASLLQGQQFVANEIASLAGVAIPEPGTALFGLALCGACGLTRRRTRA